MKLHGHKLAALTTVVLTAVLGPAAGAATIATFDFTAASVTGSNTASASAASVVTAPPGTSVGAFTQVGSTGTNISISSGTMTGYHNSAATSGNLAGAISAGRYHTFSVTLSEPWTLTDLSLVFGGTSTLASGFNAGIALQAKIGAGPITTLGSASYAVPGNTGASTPNLGGVLSANFDATFANLDDTTVTFYLYLYDDSTSNSQTVRFRDVVLTGEAGTNPVPEPAALWCAPAVLALRRRRR